MDLTKSQIAELESALEKLETLDPAEIPQPAADLAAILSSILEEGDDA